MENLQVVLQTPETFIAEWQDCYVSETKITGFVCTFQLSNKKHRFYGLNDIKKLMKEANSKKTDIYLSLNAFEYGHRTSHTLQQIRNIGVDIDCYKLNISIPQALEQVKSLIVKGSIPNPNIVILSGRGLQLVYSISGGASPKMAYLSQYITAQFISELRFLGADTSGTDVTRVFRLPYSVNSKNNRQVEIELWRTMEYSLLELYSFCKPLEQRRNPPKQNRGTLHSLPSKKGLLDLYSLNTARKNDLEALVSIRAGNIEKRNVLTYIYAYTVALILRDKQGTIEFARQLNDRLVDPQKANIIKRTAGNAYDDAMKFWDEFKNRDFEMWYKTMDGIKRPMKNSTIIEELEIESEEIRQFSTLIDKTEKQVRNTNRKRRERGSVTRQEYINEQQDKTDDKLNKLRDLLEINPKEKKTVLAEKLGIKRRRLYQLIDML
jgi:hypothetical protein